MTQIQLPAEQAWTFSRLPDLLKTLDIQPWGVLHVGAHHGEELDIYRQCGFETITLVEPDPRSVAVLREKFPAEPTEHLIMAACVPEREDGQVADLHYAERTVWSGLRPHPSSDGQSVKVATVTVSELLDDINVLVLDTQGTELDLLKTVDLNQLDLVIIETSRRSNDTAAPWTETRDHMAQHNWHLIEEWLYDGSGYSDCVYACMA